MVQCTNRGLKIGWASADGTNTSADIVTTQVMPQQVHEAGVLLKWFTTVQAVVLGLALRVSLKRQEQLWIFKEQSESRFKA